MIWIFAVGNCFNSNQEKDKGRTDIVALCKKICGANVSIGYNKEHTTEESLDYAAWLNTYTKVREMMGKPQKKWTL